MSKIKDFLVNYVEIVFFVISIIIFFCGFNNNDVCMFVGTLGVLGTSVVYCLKNINCRILYLLFLASFFVFLMGRTTIELFELKKISYIFSQDIKYHIIICLFLSLSFLFIGNLIAEKLLFKNKKSKEKNNCLINASNFKLNIQKYSKIIYIIGFCVNIVLSLEKGLYIYNHSYLEYVKSFNSQLGGILRLIANSRMIAFFIYMATIPSVKYSKIFLFMFLFDGTISLLYGDRGNFILNIFFVVFYMFFRQWKNKDEKWITKKKCIIAILLIPLLLGFLSLFVHFREGIDVGNVNLTTQITRFFKSMGNSVQIIGYGKLYENEIPDNGLYSIGDITQYIVHNPISERLFNVNELKYYTKEYALNCNSFMHTISYLISPEQYLDGHGYGSVYIAEIFYDFGYLGIIIFNFALGVFMVLIYKIYSINPILTGCIFYSYYIMMFIPRAPADYLFTYVFNLTVIFSICIIVFLSIGDSYIRRRLENGK